MNLQRPTLLRALRDELLPALRVRQSALLRIDGGEVDTLYVEGVPADQLPSAAHVPALVEAAGRCLPRGEAVGGLQPLEWVRLALPLSVGEKPIGLWLLGSRGLHPDYSQPEMDLLQSLANQTAVALTGFDEMQSLRALYRADLERAESLQASLARELHDNLLGGLAGLKTSVGAGMAPPRFFAISDALIASVRRIVADLRPAMLNYGLRFALVGLIDELSDRAEENGIRLSLDMPEDDARFDQRVEMHLYRIVQHACENAFRHADPKMIGIQGRARPEGIDLTVEDDGRGFEMTAGVDWAGLVASKRYGLAGMRERARMIGAELQIDSAPQRGTRVQLLWTPRGR